MRVGVSKRIQLRPAVLVIIYMVLLCALMAFFAVRATPVFRERAADAAAQQARRIVAEVAAEVFEGYSDRMTTRETDGDVSVLSINSIQLNMLRAEFTSRLISKLADATSTKIYISTGSLLKYEVFQGMGIRIPVKIAFGSISDVDFEHEFITAGINQTKHLVSMKVVVSSSVISAFMCDTRNVEVSLPISENIIIGKVPQYYSDRMGITAKGE